MRHVTCTDFFVPLTSDQDGIVRLSTGVWRGAHSILAQLPASYEVSDGREVDVAIGGLVVSLTRAVNCDIIVRHFTEHVWIVFAPSKQIAARIELNNARMFAVDFFAECTSLDEFGSDGRVPSLDNLRAS